MGGGGARAPHRLRLWDNSSGNRLREEKPGKNAAQQVHFGGNSGGNVRKISAEERLQTPRGRGL